MSLFQISEVVAVAIYKKVLIMKMISDEAFKALSFNEQKDYLINVIKNFSVMITTVFE